MEKDGCQIEAGVDRTSLIDPFLGPPPVWRGAAEVDFCFDQIILTAGQRAEVLLDMIELTCPNRGHKRDRSPVNSEPATSCLTRKHVQYSTSTIFSGFKLQACSAMNQLRHSVLL
jgi:hypothetical protein